MLVCARFQARAAVTKWAIEYEVPAAEAFRLNHPGAATFTDNCNVILARAMANAGLQADCRASTRGAASLRCKSSTFSTRHDPSRRELQGRAANCLSSRRVASTWR